MEFHSLQQDVGKMKKKKEGWKGPEELVQYILPGHL